ncbi:efflux RND transporter periplasmic adaptor subunit [Stieleria sp. TO1_6]|uniref:efflux RND transporter periplasmic adaptor subunit n=1 Tax=Stieleria tagensis TaxID=2956795 RepID=UPI00209B7975|nr:efflux RND transporter periplasmic adaptor subunit [Stieleria tagensis]MCO8124324.1 efflux RND transporter periplasmic adaptor subunit [Stieleria tagensis]
MFDLQTLKPKLKAGLRFSLESFGADACCIVDDPEREQYWRIGIDEFRLLSKFNGHCSVAQAAAQMQQTDLSPAEIQRVIAWMIQEGLAENLSSQSSKPKPPKLMQGINASVFYRLSLGNPQTLLRWLYPLLGFLTNPWLIGVWAATIVTALLLVAVRWDQFQTATFNVVSTDLWLYFLVIWWGLKLIHELFHGLTCLRYGGTVREAGILFLLFAPLGAYVDVTSAWRFSSKWQRIHVTLAGIYVELWLAAIAAIWWCFSLDPIVHQFCLQTILLASVATLLFNGNPLIRFDGYYFLSDLLELPNLYVRGQLAVRRVFRRIFFGTVVQSETVEPHHRLFVLLFGLACFVWKIILCAGLIISAALLFQGSGLLLAIALTFTWFVLPLLKFLVGCVRMIPRQPLRVLRATGLLGILIASAVWAAQSIEIPQMVTAPGIVRPIESSILRSEASGWLNELDVQSGQHVVQGQVLARLHNPELAIQILELRQELQRIEIRQRSFVSEGKLGEANAEAQVADQIQEQLDQRLLEQSHLEVRAPHDGVVVDFEIDALRGRHLDRGDRLFELGDLSSLEFAFSMEQSRNERLQDMDRQAPTVTVFVPGTAPIQTVSSTLTVHPQARWQLDAPALAAKSGGPIPVMEVVLDRRRMETRTLSPRIHGTLALPEETKLIPGTIGTVRISLASQSVAQRIKPWITQFYQNLADRLGEVRSPAGPNS